MRCAKNGIEYSGSWPNAGLGMTTPAQWKVPHNYYNLSIRGLPTAALTLNMGWTAQVFGRPCAAQTVLFLVIDRASTAGWRDVGLPGLRRWAVSRPNESDRLWVTKL